MASVIIPSPPPPETCMVYLDACALVDIADNRGVRNADALQLLSLFQKYKDDKILLLVTSSWAITECYSILYKKALIDRGILTSPIRKKDPRNNLPPVADALSDAKTAKDNLLNLLSTTTDFALIPDFTKNADDLFRLTISLAEEIGIWAPDSIHLAIALDNMDCSILVTDDGDFLDRIDSCQVSFIEPLRRTQFSMLPVPPPFNCYGVSVSTSLLSGLPGTPRISAFQALNSLGFVL